MDILIKSFIVIFLIVFTTSCILVLNEDIEDSFIEPEISLSPKPVLPMSEQIVRSAKGDMISQIPVGWFFVDVESKTSPDVIAVAVNPEYNLSAVFSSIKHIPAVDDDLENEGLYGLARLCLTRRERKTGGSVKLFGKYQQINMGNQEFVKYEFSSTGGAVKAKAAVFISNSDEFYEFALIPMNINNNQLPQQLDIDDVFKSILATIKY